MLKHLSTIVQFRCDNTAHEIPAVKQASYLSTQLRESVPYLRDAGWRETATLLTVAADEIEQLRARVVDLEGGSPAPERSQPRPNVRSGSWLCKNTLARALTRRDLGDMAASDRSRRFDPCYAVPQQQRDACRLRD